MYGSNEFKLYCTGKMKLLQNFQQRLTVGFMLEWWKKKKIKARRGLRYSGMRKNSLLLY